MSKYFSIRFTRSGSPTVMIVDAISPGFTSMWYNAPRSFKINSDPSIIFVFMRKCFYLSTCSTCKRIIERLRLKDHAFDLQDIKKDPIQAKELEDLSEKMGGYDKLLNRRAKKYRELDLKNRDLSDDDLYKLILSEYTLLKRPVIVFDDLVFVGNSEKTIEKIENRLHDSN